MSVGVCDMNDINYSYYYPITPLLLPRLIPTTQYMSTTIQGMSSVTKHEEERRINIKTN